MAKKIRCGRCESEPSYKYNADSQYCKKCDVWLEAECSCPSEDCSFKGRTEKPSDTPVHNWDD